jgi:hypothetical protein
MSTVHPGTGRTDCAGYSDCIFLENENTRVVLGHQSGGGILEYSHGGENILFSDPAQEGKTWKPGNPIFGPKAGRFDIGPEKILPEHPVLWVGEWSGDITGPRSAKLTSQVDPKLNVQLVREFRLDADSSHLTCRQTIINKSPDKVQRLCHWSRTLAKGGGICVIPLGDYSRFPNSWVMYGPDEVIQYQPEDPNVKIRSGFLEILAPPAEAKLGMDSMEGWFAYLMPDHWMFLKSYVTHPDRVYNEIAGLTVSVWAPADGSRIELEPIGPMEVLKPGKSATFEEEWWLVPFQFPEAGKKVDLDALEQAVRNEL